ncbi:hypothetical protein diail_1294 [Diaporthe ilicicola]|nr:hypothetical protein diail_1294 [Diaporthe ilicicola]
MASNRSRNPKGQYSPNETKMGITSKEVAAIKFAAAALAYKSENPDQYPLTIVSPPIKFLSPRQSTPYNSSDYWYMASDDTSDNNYQIIGGSTEFSDTRPLLTTENENSLNTTTAPTTPTSPGTGPIRAQTTTMEVSLDRVKLVQVFLYADHSSVKGLCFIYKDSDMVELGCCEAEPNAWYAFTRPKYFLFTPSPGSCMHRGFFRVESIGFAPSLNGPETETNAILMEDSVMLRLSPEALEIDTRDPEERAAAQIEEATQEIEPRLGSNGAVVIRRKRTFKQAMQALKRWFRRRSVF